MLSDVPNLRDKKLAFPEATVYFFPAQISSVLSVFNFSRLADIQTAIGRIYEKKPALTRVQKPTPEPAFCASPP